MPLHLSTLFTGLLASHHRADRGQGELILAHLVREGMCNMLKFAPMSLYMFLSILVLHQHVCTSSILHLPHQVNNPMENPATTSYTTGPLLDVRDNHPQLSAKLLPYDWNDARIVLTDTDSS